MGMLSAKELSIFINISVDGVDGLDGDMVHLEAGVVGAGIEVDVVCFEKMLELSLVALRLA